jgi:hypothetical protein
LQLLAISIFNKHTIAKMHFTTFVLAALSLGSAIAAPAVGLPAFNDALTAVGSVKIIVEQQVTTVST